MKRQTYFLLLVTLFVCAAVSAQTEMLGSLTKESILKSVPDWEAMAAAYSPKPEIIQKLKMIGQPIQIEVFLGTWCPDSKAHVSAYFKILEMADNPLIQTSYIGIPKEKSARAKALPKDKAIEKLPTFLVYKNGRELGRITETPTKSVEEDLIAILNK